MKVNGSLVFDASSASEIQNLRVEKVSSLPAHGGTPNNQGRALYLTTTNTLYIGSATAWVAMATGGNAASLQTEVDAIETTLGALINADGTSNLVAALSSPLFGGATDLTTALANLATAVNTNDALAELSDVALVSAANKDFLMYNGTKWVDHVLVAADLTDVTSTAAELNILDGATLDVTELNFVDGVTSSIQGQLDNKQPLDAGLTALAAFNTNGILVQTADNVFAGRTLVAPAEGVTLTNANGVAGNPTIGLANDLGALEALAATGYAIRTGTDTWATRAITGAAGQIAVTNGNGVASNTDVGLATVTDTGVGTFKKITTDSFGRVIGTAAVVASDIEGLVNGTYVNVDGDSMASGANLTFSGGGTVTGLAAPSADTDAATKAYVDATAAGLTWKNAARVATTANIALTGLQTIDGVSVAAGNRVLVKNQTLAKENGVYVAAAGAWTRATDMDAAAEFDGAALFVQEGTLNESSGWTQTATVAAVGTDAVTFSQFSGGAIYTWGIGLSATGNTINVNLGAGIAQLPSDEVGIDLFNTTSGAIILTDDGTTRAAAPATNSTLHLLLDTTATGGLNQGVNGLFIKANGVTNAMILNDTNVLNGDSGSGTLALGETLQVIGTSAQGISTSVAGQAITITAADATTASKGVASFAAADFAVAAGVVTVKAGGIDNAQLANSTVTLTGTTGNDAFALGESVAIVGGAGGEVSTNVTANQVAITVRDATAALKGVASFDAADFTVTAGAVTVVAKGLDALTDVTITSPAAGQTLVHNGAGQFENKKVFHLYSSVAAATSHAVTHGIGQKYCNVTVVDSTDNVVIPQSIVFDSNSQLTVTFNTAIDCKVIVMGIA